MGTLTFFPCEKGHSCNVMELHHSIHISSYNYVCFAPFFSSLLYIYFHLWTRTLIGPHAHTYIYIYKYRAPHSHITTHLRNLMGPRALSNLRCMAPIQHFLISMKHKSKKEPTLVSESRPKLQRLRDFEWRLIIYSVLLMLQKEIGEKRTIPQMCDRQTCLDFTMHG